MLIVNGKAEEKRACWRLSTQTSVLSKLKIDFQHFKKSPIMFALRENLECLAIALEKANLLTGK